MNEIVELGGFLRHLIECSSFEEQPGKKLDYTLRGTENYIYAFSMFFKLTGSQSSEVGKE